MNYVHIPNVKALCYVTQSCKEASLNIDSFCFRVVVLVAQWGEMDISFPLFSSFVQMFSSSNVKPSSVYSVSILSLLVEGIQGSGTLASQYATINIPCPKSTHHIFLTV